MSQGTERFLEVDAGSKLHYRDLGEDHKGATMVFLHEGLGSVELWRDFPNDLVDRTGLPGFVYSRRGHGWSTPLDGPRRSDYMHTEALEVLPAVIAEMVDGPPVLVGHSDGASIALVYAGAGHQVDRMVLIAPHVFTEPEGLGSIAAVAKGFPESDMAEKMGKYHEDPESTFYGWADVWLSPEFREWNLEEYLPAIRCPILLVQGDEDEYGTTRQLDAIETGVAGPVERVLIPGARHSPHLSDRDTVITAAADFIGRGE